MLELTKKYKLVILLVVVVLMSIFMIKTSQKNKVEMLLSSEGTSLPIETAQVAESVATEIPEEIPTTIPVYICGAVRQPGVYYVEAKALLQDVLGLCQGVEAEADLSALNLASGLVAHEKIYVPKKGEEIDKNRVSYDNKESLLNEGTQLLGATDCININTASKEELMTLSGIGEAKANEIINYRTTVHLFQSIDQITEVSGIGDKTFEKIKQSITI